MAEVGYDIYEQMQQDIAQTKKSLRTLASVMVSNTGGKIANAHRILDILVTRPLVMRVDPNHCDPALKDLHNLNPGYANIGYSDLEGRVICSALPQPGGKPANIGETQWFQKFLKQKSFRVGEPFIGPISGKWVSVLSAPILNQRREMVGAVHLPLDLAAFDPHIPTQFLSAQSRYGFLSDDGLVIWKNLDPEGVIGTRPNLDTARRMIALRDGEFESLGVDNVLRFFSIVRMPETGWIAFIGVPVTEVYAAAKQRAVTALAFGLTGIVLLVLLALAIARRITKPVAELERTAHIVHDGNLGARVAIGGPREILAVAQEFNAMTEALQLSDAQLRAFLENSAVIAWMKDEDCRYVFVSDNFLKRFAFSREAVIGKSERELWPQPITDTRCADDIVLLEQGGTLEAVESRTNPDGGISWWLSNKFIFQGPDGKRLLGGLAVDITERKHVESVLQNSEARYRNFVEELSLGVVITQEGLIKYVNPALARMIGYSEEELLERPFLPMIAEADRSWLLDLHQRRMRGETVESSYVVGMICKGGEVRQWQGYTSTIEWDGKPSGMGCFTDITQIRQAETEQRIAAAAFESQEGMVITDADNVILKVNRAFTESTGYSAEDVVGRTPSLLKSGRHDTAFYAAMWESIRQTGGWQGEIWDKRKNGEIYPKWLTITAVKSADGAITHYVGTHTDITARKHAEEEITYLAFYDSLTQLPNRRLLLDRLGQALASSARSGLNGALIFIDLDNFKTLNDTLGHDKGDLLLQQVAQRLSACVREGDTVARLGGDEFVVMLEGLSENSEEAATLCETVGEKIISTLNQPYRLAGFENRSTPSIGVTLFSGHRSTIEELLKQADLAMYQAKTAGRNTLRFFDPQMQAIVTDRANLEVDLREALKEKQFMLYYQPQVVGEGRLTGAEALVRWQHPRRGLVSPAEFIPLAEETGLILPLGRMVLEDACAQLARWAARPNTAHLTLAVNVSAHQFRQADFVEQVLAALAAAGANPHKLKLELTESLLVTDIENTIVKMSALKAQGVGFSLDDFGTGYSSLSYLKRLPLDQLKIDRSFVRDILIDPNDAAIAKMVIVLAESMGLTVIAEGVEIQAQRDILAHQGCHAYQGYLFSRPQTLLEFEAFAKLA